MSSKIAKDAGGTTSDGYAEKIRLINQLIDSQFKELDHLSLIQEQFENSIKNLLHNGELSTEKATGQIGGKTTGMCEASFKDFSKLDLMAYGNSYRGMAFVIRLAHVADKSPALREEALRMVLSYAQRSYNTTLYQNMCMEIQKIENTDEKKPTSVTMTDMEWVCNNKEKFAKALGTGKLRLSQLQRTLAKEELRSEHIKLAELYLESGDCKNALKHYKESVKSSTSYKQHLESCLAVMKVSIYAENWNESLSFADKARSSQFTSEPMSKMMCKLNLYSGLAHMMLYQYKDAAMCFVSAVFDHVTEPELLSRHNVATYGTLCALATFDLKEVTTFVTGSSTFRVFLQLDPVLIEIINQFSHPDTSCVRALDKVRDALKLDVYICHHIDDLIKRIRDQATIEYLNTLSINVSM